MVDSRGGVFEKEPVKDIRLEGAFEQGTRHDREGDLGHEWISNVSTIFAHSDRVRGDSIGTP